jgi:hypothetical protein
MTIRTELTDEWREVMEALSDRQRKLLLDEADYLAHAIAYRHQRARISTNSALELLFAIGCWQNKIESKGEPQ